MIDELISVIQPYAWGSRSALAALRGEPPASAPEAELWMGAHPLAPSHLRSTGESLLEVIARDPGALLGADVAHEHAGRLPFLLKVLAAAAPLSLQAHPSLTQAAQGFAADEAERIPLTAPGRNYKDQNHKPELLCALTEFWALCGFRPVPATLDLLAELDVPALAAYREQLTQHPDQTGLKQLFSSLMLASGSDQRALADSTAAACQARLGQSSRFADEYRWAARLAELYPGDIGIVSALLLNLLRLSPGEAIYLPAGNLHAYLGGTGVEIMASSDNVLRGGLTPKHVNVPELLRILDFRPLPVTPLQAEARGMEHVYATPAREFRLSYFDLDASSLETPLCGPEIWLVTRGSFQLASSEHGAVQLTQGRSAFVPAAAKTVKLSGTGRIFRARVAD